MESRQFGRIEGNIALLIRCVLFVLVGGILIALVINDKRWAFVLRVVAIDSLRCS